MATTSKTTDIKKKAPAKAMPKATTKTAPKKVTSPKKEAAPKKASSAKAASASAAKPKVSVAKATAGQRQVSNDKRKHYIEVAAYYIAERRGFIGGNAADDWRAAEAEIDRLLAEGKLNVG